MFHCPTAVAIHPPALETSRRCPGLLQLLAEPKRSTKSFLTFKTSLKDRVLSACPSPFMPKSGGNAEGSPAHFILPELEAQPLESTSGIAEELILEAKGERLCRQRRNLFCRQPWTQTVGGLAHSLLWVSKPPSEFRTNPP